jgi:uncharacterized protein
MTYDLLQCQHFMTNAYWIALIGGAAAFAHCLGMCGPFALHLSNGPHGLGRQLLWQAGKATTYVFLGALAGLTGSAVLRSTWLGAAQNWLAYLAGAVMIVMGLLMLGVLPRRAVSKEDVPGRRGLFSSLFGQFFLQPTSTAALVLGLACGFLPCPVVMGFLALAVQSGSALSGMGIMAAMGAGTVWSLLLLGISGRMIGLRLRRWGAVGAGVILIVAGAATALRGTDTFHRLLGCPMHQAGATAATSTAPAGASQWNCPCPGCAPANPCKCCDHGGH